MHKTKVNQNERNVSPLVKTKDSIQMINDGTYEFGDPTVMWLRMPLDSWVTVTKSGVVDKSRAFAPTYPQFVMRNSDLRSS